MIKFQPPKHFDGKSVLITGGTGSFGKKMAQFLLQNSKLKRLVIFSRDELKQFDMMNEFSKTNSERLRFFIGDVRDAERLILASRNIDIIIHAAAMKQILAAEYNPTECIATNVLGAQNVIKAAITNRVSKVIALSTDKAASPTNLYGATKLCSDKLFIAANNLSGDIRTRFSIVRYGNVIGSRGSVIPLFKSLIASGTDVLPLTDKEMTRFMISLAQGVNFVSNVTDIMTGGEIFIPKLPSAKIFDIAQIISPNKYEIVGIRPGEKLHEVMLPMEDARNSLEFETFFLICPTSSYWSRDDFIKGIFLKGVPVSPSFVYSSDKNESWLEGKELASLIDSF
ncbi:UDP-N-acetylglucosamine 4,6-dehydratase (inverting) [Alphaproteobacteria bacterium]|nr:UDP-N-acetylglucosamine 4,6-dehydratase (inverting) [Alphaproteobacteria bacterium]